MKTTFKTIFRITLAILFGLFIGYSIADYVISSEEVEIVNEDKAETIVELMGTESSFAVKGNCKMCKIQSRRGGTAFFEGMKESEKL